jgi:uncharacterized surface protein with fasciclin (FAS1) repeats
MNKNVLIGLVAVLVIGGVLYFAGQSANNSANTATGTTTGNESAGTGTGAMEETTMEGTTGAGDMTGDAAASGTIVEVAQSNGSFNTLVAAVQAAGLVETLNGEGPFTVFAPTDEAFAKLPAGTVEDLLKPENKDQLTKILTYHVVAGNVPSSQVATMTSATTVQGGTVTFDTMNGVKVNNAMVVTPDVAASNGVIHVIDTVLMPE